MVSHPIMLYFFFTLAWVCTFPCSVLKTNLLFKPFHATDLFLYPVKKNNKKNRGFLIFSRVIERDQSQQTHNVVPTFQRCTTNTQHCSDVDATTSELQRCSYVAPTFDSMFNSQYTMDVVVTTLLQH